MGIYYYQMRRMGSALKIYFLFIIPTFLLDPYFQSGFKIIKEYLMNYTLILLIDRLMDIIGNGGYQAVLCLLFFVAGLYFRRKGLSYAGKYGFIGIVTSGILVQILKHLIGRARPVFDNAYLFWGPSIKNGLIGFDSFPSGHTIGAFTLATIFSEVYSKGKAIFYGLAVLIGFWRLYDNSHFLSDVFTGMVLGLMVGKWLVNRYPLRDVKED